METLKELYFIHSPSECEDGIQGYIRAKLFSMGIAFGIDEHNQTYCLSNDSFPLVCAHTDQVGTYPITYLKTTAKYIRGDGNLGADDKNGIWIVLELLKIYPELNFIFSTCEEIGGNVSDLLNDDNTVGIPYALVFDRRGGGDIIGEGNGYCSIEFEDQISDIGLGYGYAPAFGVWSDCDAISRYLNCVNLSCGYYDAHTTKEYTNIPELKNALSFGLAILEADIQPSPIYNDFYEADTITDVCPECGDFLEYGYCWNCDKEIYDYDTLRDNKTIGSADYSDINYFD